MHPELGDRRGRLAHARSELTKEIFGDEVTWTPWLRPGFELGLELRADRAGQPEAAKASIMGQHGLINWADDDKECYELTLDLIEKAARLHRGARQGREDLRRREVSSRSPTPRATSCCSTIAALAARPGLAEASASSPPCRPTPPSSASSTATTRRVWPNSAPPAPTISCAPKSSRSTSPGIRRPKTSPTLKAKLTAGLEQYRKDYAAYYERCKHPNSPAMRDPNPTVILIPGIGMIAWGKDKSESRVTAEFYNCAVEVMRGAEAIDEYIALPQQEAFDIEYWLLEEAKLKRMPPEKELARNVVVVVGAGNGIGKAVAHRLAKEGAHVVCADSRLRSRRRRPPNELTKIYGVGIGVAGTGISGCGPAIGVAGRTSPIAPASRAMLKQAVLAYGGIDHIDRHRRRLRRARSHRPHHRRRNGRLTFDVNVMGGYLVGDEARARLRAPGPARQPGAHHQRQRRRREERFARLRCFKGRRESSGPRPRRRTVARWCASMRSRPRP